MIRTTVSGRKHPRNVLDTPLHRRTLSVFGSSITVASNPCLLSEGALRLHSFGHLEKGACRTDESTIGTRYEGGEEGHNSGEDDQGYGRGADKEGGEEFPVDPVGQHAGPEANHQRHPKPFAETLQ